MKARFIFCLILLYIVTVMGCGLPDASDDIGDEIGIPANQSQTGNSVVSAGGDDGLGSPAMTEADNEAFMALADWIEGKNIDGLVIPGYPDTTYTGLLVDWEHTDHVFSLAINREEINPLHQRGLMEAIVKKWISLYPENQQPAGLLRLMLYDGEINPDKALGYSEIDSNRRVNTVHYATEDIR